MVRRGRDPHTVGLYALTRMDHILRDGCTLRRAAREVGAKGLCLAGGVAANSRLREKTLDVCVEDGYRAFLPSRAMCTDNAAMVAAAGWWRLAADGPSPLDIGANPSLRLPVS